MWHDVSRLSILLCAGFYRIFLLVLTLFPQMTLANAGGAGDNSKKYIGEFS
jgi:Na+/H+-translocating membrane pyrophosphatase